MIDLMKLFPYVYLMLTLLLGHCQKPQGVYQGFFLANDALLIAGPGQQIKRISPDGHAAKELYNPKREGLVYPLPDESALLLVGENGATLVDGAEQYAPIPLKLEKGDSPLVGAVMTKPGFLWTVSQNGTLQAWQWEQKISEKNLRLKRPPSEPPLRQGVFSIDGSLLLTLYDKGAAVKLWDVQTGRLIQAFAGPQDNITSALFSKDQKHILIGSADGSAWLWNDFSFSATPWLLVGKTQPFGAGIVKVAFAHQDKLFLTVDTQGTLRVWEYLVETVPFYRKRIRLLQTYFASQVGITSISFSQDDQKILLVTDLGEVQVIQFQSAPNFQLLGSFARRNLSFGDFDLSPDGDFLVTTSSKAGDDVMRIWNVQDIQNESVLAEVQPRATFPTPAMGLISKGIKVAFSKDGDFVASGHQDGSVRAWDVRGKNQTPWNGVPLFPIQSAHRQPISALAFSPGQQFLATASIDQTAALFDFTEGNRGQLLSTLTGHTAEVTSLAFSPSGFFLLTGSKDQTAILWNIQNPQNPVLVSQISLGTPIAKVLFADSDQKVVVGGQDGKVYHLLWTDPKIPQIQSFLAHQWQGVPQPISGLALFADGKSVLSAGKEGNTFLWMGDSPEYLSSFCFQEPDSSSCASDFTSLPHALPALSLAFSKQNNRLAILHEPMIEFIQIPSFSQILQLQAND